MATLHYTANRATRRSSLGIVGANGVIGCTIVDRRGAFIGELRDIMLDLSTGRIGYAVIATRPRSNGEQLIIVPWNAVHLDQHSERLRINAHADWIERAPSVDPGDAPDRFIQEWGVFIHNYFGTRPYWEAPSAQQYS